eukprot:CAMPEP_0206602594 /NCGR_PEP_ID=MMETSP0325_2-20121206/47519_1 /ASSEMBLY_ACC=CAM_ASM_000347 /TAXON_ID=2866 /ORGANISM="Crypthecodinium cohnii, Strain Seligo" /LENGTH=50 /DNA_ID=CAMNT_0054115189 /DNA_START=89 /DNA_END=241 /DNA_ORIENTATION=-
MALRLYTHLHSAPRPSYLTGGPPSKRAPNAYRISISWSLLEALYNLDHRP